MLAAIFPESITSQLCWTHSSPVYLVCHVDKPLVAGVVPCEVDDVGDDPSCHEGGQDQPVEGVAQGGDAWG